MSTAMPEALTIAVQALACADNRAIYRKSLDVEWTLHRRLTVCDNGEDRVFPPYLFVRVDVPNPCTTYDPERGWE